MKVLVSDKLSEDGLQVLKNCSEIQVDVKTGLKPEELKQIIGDYDALIIRSSTTVTADLLESATKLKLIGRAGIGVDNVDLEAASKHGVIVENTPSGNAVTTAEHAIAMMFAVSRMIPQATMTMKEGKWEKKLFMGRELCNKYLGVVGVGNIGKIVADRALGLKMRVLGFDPFLTPEAASKMGIELVGLDELFKRSDYITVHVPLNDKTKNLINAQSIEQMKKGVFIINCARGGIVDEKALLAGLESGKVGGAALDVFEEEPPPADYALIRHPKVICTPHLGAATDEAQLNVAIEVAEQIVAYFTKGEVKNAVNYPSMSGELAKILKPYIQLAESLGRLQGYMAKNTPRRITIEYSGEIAQYPLAALTTCALKGIFEILLTDVGVNYVNSPLLAKERGIQVVESKLSDVQDYHSLIKTVVETETCTTVISGTILGRGFLRLVQINDFTLDALPQGQILLVHNYDKPGVVGNVGTTLGESKVNISRMQLGLNPKTGEAMALYNIDSPAGPEVLEKLRKIPNIISVQQVRL